MAIRIDPALHAMPQRMQDEFRHEVAGTRRGPIADAVLPLNAALLDRQARIDALTAQVDRLRAEADALRPDAKRYRWLAKEHGWWLLLHFSAVRPYVDASEVIDESIDAAMNGAP